MVLDPSIILRGQTPDIVGNFGRGIATGQQMRQAQSQNALANLYQTQGAGIANGDPAALNALAGVDPMASLKVQDARLGMDAQRQTMGYQSEAAKRAAAEYARGISAQQAAQESAQLERAVKTAMMARTPEEFDALMQSSGATQFVGKFNEREALAAQFMSFKEILDMRAGEGPDAATKGAPSGYLWNDPSNPGAGVSAIPGMEAKPADDYGRYVQEEAAAGRQPMGRIEYAQAIKGNGVTQTITNPDGTTTTIQVGGKAADKQAVAQQNKQNTANLLVEDIGRAKQLVLANPRLTTGLVGNALRTWAGTPSADLAALLDTIGANISFDRLQAMRDASPTGGALGSITERELALLQATQGAIAQSQSAEQLMFNLDRLEKQYGEIVNGTATPEAVSPESPRRRLRFNPATGDFE